eukprot:Colp12_sorted_trinity150504_noHs@24739
MFRILLLRGQLHGCRQVINWRTFASKPKVPESTLAGFASHVERVVKEWHPTKNALTPDMVPPDSKSMFWWKCSRKSNHMWEATVYSRMAALQPCPQCVEPEVTSRNSVAYKHPVLIALWHPQLNPVGPDEVAAKTFKPYWFRCSKDRAHVWQSQPLTASGEPTHCPRCGPLKPEEVIDSATAKTRPTSSKKATADSEKVASSKQTTKRATEDSNSSPGKAASSKKAIKQVAEETSAGSEKAAKSTKRVTDVSPGSRKNVPSLEEVRPDLAAEWNTAKNKPLTPKEVTAKSRKMVWWRCSANKKHEWEASIEARGNEKAPCPYCTHEEANNQKSLANKYPEIANEWLESKNTNTPQNVLPTSKEPAWWQCSQCGRQTRTVISEWVKKRCLSCHKNTK